jgi:hypothetical protein
MVSMLLCSACGSLETVDESNVDTLLDDFVNGRIVLSGAFSRVWPWSQNNQAAKALYNVKDWQKLSKLIIQINNGTDLSWFYLARSAEGLGFSDVSIKYYIEALETNYKCDSLLSNICDGFVFPVDIFYRLSVLGVKCRVVGRRTNECAGLPPSLYTPNYGAIAWDSETGRRGWSWNEPTAERAAEMALGQCGDPGCKILLRTNGGMCAALATTESGRFADAESSYRDRDAAKVAALDKCAKGNAGECTIRVSDCNTFAAR